MKLLFEQKQGIVLINNKKHSILNNSVVLDIADCWQVLQLEAEHTPLKITNIVLDQRPIDHLLYIMYDHNNQCNFGDLFPNSKYYMPVHPRYAIFRSRVYQQLTNGWYGKQIYHDYEFVLDQSITFKKLQPKHIQDYFQINTGPHWIRKWDPTSSWFFSDSVDTKELKKNIDVSKFPEVPGHADTNSGWVMRHLKFTSIEDLEKLGLTELAVIAKKENFISIDTVSCNTLKSGGHIGIHLDGHMNKPSRKKLYFNLDPSNGVYFKFASTGLVPMNTDRGIWINTDQHVHSVVNDSDNDRLMVSISGDVAWKQNA